MKLEGDGGDQYQSPKIIIAENVPTAMKIIDVKKDTVDADVLDASKRCVREYVACGKDLQLA